MTTYLDRPIAFQVNAEQDTFIREEAWRARIPLAEYLRRLIEKAMARKAAK